LPSISWSTSWLFPIYVLIFNPKISSWADFFLFVEMSGACYFIKLLHMLMVLTMKEKKSTTF
jgi:hypothetical protein